MKIHFRLGWVPGAAVKARDFKSPEYHALFTDYLGRIAHHAPAGVSGIDLDAPEKVRGRVWFCHGGAKTPALSSEELAKKMNALLNGGVGEWQVVIGPADGFTSEALQRWKPDALWSFGPMTYPHEMAAVIASEQVYRAWTILKKHPYHAGH